MSDDAFYATLKPLGSFRDSLKPEYYSPVPDSWYVLMTDVVGSTQAIAGGQYKQINYLGASSIMAVLNVLRPQEVPFIFGGDGASILVSPRQLQIARDALLGVRQLAHMSFDLDLRVGIVPVKTIRTQADLRVAKVRMSRCFCQASFMGGGLTYASQLIKADSTYRVDYAAGSTIDLTGLGCRWQDVPSLYGHTLSLMVAPGYRPDISDRQVFAKVLTAIEKIYGDDSRYRPVVEATLRLSFNPRKLAVEVKARSADGGWRRRALYWIKVLLENWIGLSLMTFGITPLWKGYKREVSLATDFQKIDDLLRMVISGAPAQTQKLQAYLEEQFQAGELAYGLHISDRALMTCLIFNRRNHHIHLVDGADGGYAIAAKSLKARLQKLS